ncbi:hypothetical protein, partial [Mycobacterium leprae]|uniref:hypothetical protein n=1 Tax=Mycobacterium leprae TaxID=1769 RepID=UPI001E4F8E40
DHHDDTLKSKRTSYWLLAGRGVWHQGHIASVPPAAAKAAPAPDIVISGSDTSRHAYHPASVNTNCLLAKIFERSFKNIFSVFLWYNEI